MNGDLQQAFIRKALDDAKLSEHKDTLLAPTKIYVKDILKLKKAGIIPKGLCHITGGGFYDNIPWILPKGCSVVIDSASWEVPAIFKLIAYEGQIEKKEIYRVLNMGIGMIMVVDPKFAPKVCKVLPGSIVIGEVVKGKREVTIKNI